MLQTLVQVLAKSMNVGVCWSDSAHTFSIRKDVETGRMEVVLSRQALQVKPGEIAPLSTVLRGAIAHEAAGHGVHTQFEDLLREPPYAKHLQNIIEDARIEKAVPIRFAGAKQILADMAVELENRGFWRDPKSPDELIMKFLARRLRQDFLGQPLDDAHTREIETAARDLLGDQLADAILAEGMQGAASSSTKEAGEAAMRILKLLQQSQPEQPQDPQPEQGQGDSADGDDGEGESAGSDQTDDQSDEANPQNSQGGDAGADDADGDEDGAADSDSSKGGDDGEGKGEQGDASQDSSSGKGGQQDGAQGSDAQAAGENAGHGSSSKPDASEQPDGSDSKQGADGNRDGGQADRAGSQGQAGKDGNAKGESNAADAKQPSDGPGEQSGDQGGDAGKQDGSKPSKLDGSKIDPDGGSDESLEGALEAILNVVANESVNTSFGRADPIILEPQKSLGKPVSSLAHKVREKLRNHLYAVTHDEDDAMSDRGLLNMSLLPQIGSGMFVDRAFVEPGAQGPGLDTALFLLVDKSTSTNCIASSVAEVMMAIGDATTEFTSAGLNMGLAQFNTRLEVLIELGKPWRPVRGWVNDAYQPYGSTWWPPCASGLLPMLAASPRRRKILLTVTDGDIGGENASHPATLDTMAMAKHLGVEMAFLEITHQSNNRRIPVNAGFIVEHVHANGPDVAKAIGKVLQSCTAPQWR